MSNTYPEYREQLLALGAKLAKEVPATVQAFQQLHKTALQEGVLSFKIKELMAIAIAISARCEGCLAHHVNNALKAGASRAEICETIGVAIMMGGGPSMIYACEAFKALEEFEAKFGAKS